MRTNFINPNRARLGVPLQQPKPAPIVEMREWRVNRLKREIEVLSRGEK